MFADLGQWLSGALAIVWVGLLLRSESTRRRGGAATSRGVLVVLGLAVLLFAAQAWLGDRIDDAGGGPARVDAAVWSVAMAHRTPAVTAVAEFLNVAGGMVGVALLAAVAAAVLLLRGRRLDAAVMLIAPVASAFLGWSAKLGYSRPRPPAHGQLVTVSDFSLPSGHALDATVVGGVLALLVVRQVGRPVARAAVVTLATATVIVSGAARVYLGVHWVTDVLTGWLLGGAWVLLSSAVLLVAGSGSAGRAGTGVGGTTPARTGPRERHRDPELWRGST